MGKNAPTKRGQAIERITKRNPTLAPWVDSIDMDIS
jgi:hypothetical protein